MRNRRLIPLLTAALSGTAMGQCPPAAPTGLTAVASGTCGRIDLDWNDVSGATSYTVYRNTTNNWSTSEWQGITFTNSFHGTPAELGVTQYYWVTAYRSFCLGNPTSPHSAVAFATASYEPQIPTSDVQVVDGCGGGLTVKWGPPTQPSGCAPQHYQIFRRTTNIFPVLQPYNSLIETVDGTQREYLDRSVEPGTTYYYWVRPTNHCGEGPEGDPVDGTWTDRGPPDNDRCEGALPLPAGAWVQGENICAIGELTGICGATGAAPDVWYRFTAPGNGTLRVDLCGNTGFSPRASIFSQCPATLASLIGCPGSQWIFCGNASYATTEAPVVGGARYYARIADNSGREGSFNVRFTFTAAACYANCDASTVAPALNVADFSCFLNSFAAGNTYANCDGSTIAPALNIADFTCFMNAFAAGCS